MKSWRCSKASGEAKAALQRDSSMWKAYVHNRTMILYFVGIIWRDGGISRRLCVSMHHSCHPVIKLISKGRQAELSIPGIIRSRNRCRHTIRHQPNSADGYRHAIRHRPNPAGWSRFPVHRGEPVGYPATAGARRLVL